MIRRDPLPYAGLVSIALHAGLLLLLNHLLAFQHPFTLAPPFTPGPVSIDIRPVPTPLTPIPEPVPEPRVTEAPVAMEPVQTTPAPPESDPQPPAPPQPVLEQAEESAVGVIEENPHPLEPIAPVYPLGARHRGEEGVVTITAVLSPEGRVLDARTAQSSGYESLDRAALKAMRRARFNIPSSQINTSTVSLVFQFSLTNAATPATIERLYRGQRDEATR